VALLLAAGWLAAAAEVGGVENVALTVYNQDLALVKETREFSFAQGLNFLTLTGVPSAIDTTSVHFKPLTGAVTLLEQNYDYDLVSRTKLLQKYLGATITIIAEDGTRTAGRLLSVSDGIVIDAGGKVLLNPPGYLELPSLPGGLLLRPTLEWQVQAPQAFTTKGEVSYLTSGLSWSADYVVMLSDSEKLADLEGWVTMRNHSGASYENARLKLVAGEIHRAPAPAPVAGKMLAEADMMRDGGGFVEEAFFEYHLYTLERRTTIRDNQEKQISLLEGSNIPTAKVYTYDPDWRGDQVEVRIEFKNAEQNGLGIPLPAGRVRVFKRDREGMAQLVGEDAIDHTPKDELVRLLLGNAFDIKGEKTQTDYVDLKQGFRASYEIVLRNHKQEAVTVLVPHHIGYANWKVLASSLDYRKKDALTIEFAVPVKPDGETKLTYTIEAWWR